MKFLTLFIHLYNSFRLIKLVSKYESEELLLREARVERWEPSTPAAPTPVPGLRPGARRTRVEAETTAETMNDMNPVRSTTSHTKFQSLVATSSTSGRDENC